LSMYNHVKSKKHLDYLTKWIGADANRTG
jgi:hypothetical protein